jgi:DNA-binding IclR family transcriptional regulator
MSEAGRSPRGRSVIGKAVAVLETFRRGSRELSLNQLAAQTGLPTSTVFRIANELVAASVLERAEGGGYRVGLRAWEIGARADPATSMYQVVVPFMQDLYEVTHENVQLAILDHHEALYIEKIYGSRSARIRNSRGGRLPLHCTGAGKLLLAHAPPELVDELVGAGLKAYTSHTITGPERLNRALKDIRRAGIAYQREEMDRGLMSVAAPVLDAGGTVVSALSVVLRASPNTLHRLAPAVRTAAASASREMREYSIKGVNIAQMISLSKEWNAAGRRSTAG